MDTSARRIDVLDAERSWSNGGFEPRPLPRAELAARPELAERVARLAERRLDIPATIRLLLDATTTCMDGVTPTGLEIREAW
jgi:hypothetical protein